MGLFDKLFGNKPKPPPQTDGYFKLLNGYQPVFTSRDGGLYEMELTRAVIHAFAKHAKKLKPEVTGAAKTHLKNVLDFEPGYMMDTSKWLYRIATIYKVATAVFIVPLTDPSDSMILGFHPVLPANCELYEFDGQPWIKYTFGNGQSGVIEFSRVGVLCSHNYKNEYWGDGHAALSPTLDLLDINRQGMSEAVLSSAAIRFIGKVAGNVRPEDVDAARQKFADDNLTSANKTGVMVYDNKFEDMKPIESKPWLIDAEQMKLIKDNVFGYFGGNDAILRNEYDEEGWNAFYEGEVEPFALELSLVLTNMAYTQRERATGNRIMFSSNRLQYASNTTKVSVTQNLVDRGLMSSYQACDIFNLPYPTNENGELLPERWVIRGEYIDIANLPEHTLGDARSYLNPMNGGDDDDQAG